MVGAATSLGLLAGTVALALVLAGLVLLRSPAAMGYTLVGLIPVISGVQRGLPVPGLRLSELLIVALATMIFLTRHDGVTLKWRVIDWLALAYVVTTALLGFVGTTLRGASLSGDDIGALAGPLQFLLLYRSVAVALPTAPQRHRALRVVMGASVPVSALAIMEAFDFPGVRTMLVALTGVDFSDRLSWTILRASGPFEHWTMLSGYLLAVVLLCSALLLQPDASGGRRLAKVALGASAAALVLTVTLAPMIGALLGVMMLAAWSRRLARTAGFVVVGVVILGIAFSPVLASRAQEQFGERSPSSNSGQILPTTVSNRIDIWTEQYMPVIQRHLLTGYGPQVPDEITWPYSESIYLTMLLRGGIPLFVVYAALMVAAAVMSRRAQMTLVPDDRALARMMYALILLIAVIQTIVPYFITTGLPHLWWALLALVRGMPGATGPNGRARSPVASNSGVTRTAVIDTGYAQRHERPSGRSPLEDLSGDR